MRLNRPLLRILVFVGLLACMAAAPTGSPGAAQTKSSRFEAITRPSDRRELRLRIPDLVREVTVKRGDKVKAGQVLLIEDDREEEINLRIQELEANSEVVVQQAQAALDYKKVELRRIEKLYNEGRYASDQELDKARVEVRIGELDLRKAEQDREKAQLLAERQRATLARMRIVAPIDGIIEEIEMDVGEVVDPQKAAVIVVKNDPLWIEVHLPTAVSLKLKDGQLLNVIHPEAQGAPPKKAKVIYFAPEADASSGTQLVRLELPNPDGQFSGLPVLVEVPPSGAVAGAPQDR